MSFRLKDLTRKIKMKMAGLLPSIFISLIKWHSILLYGFRLIILCIFIVYIQAFERTFCLIYGVYTERNNLSN